MQNEEKGGLRASWNSTRRIRKSGIAKDKRWLVSSSFAQNLDRDLSLSCGDASGSQCPTCRGGTRRIGMCCRGASQIATALPGTSIYGREALFWRRRPTQRVQHRNGSPRPLQDRIQRGRGRHREGGDSPASKAPRGVL